MPPPVSCIEPLPPGTATGLESGIGAVCTHSRFAASPSPLPVVSTAATTQARSPTATTARTPRGMRSLWGASFMRPRQYWNPSQIRDLGDGGGAGGYRALMAKKAPTIGAGDVQTHTATVHGREVSYVEAGSGPLLLL